MIISSHGKQSQRINKAIVHQSIFLFKQAFRDFALEFSIFLDYEKIAPALVIGNTIVIKPSSKTPNNAYEFARLVEKKRDHLDIGMVSLMSSVETGVKIMETTSKNIIK